MTDQLAQAWPRLGLEGLLTLVTVHIGLGNWEIVDNRIQGPCPAPCPGPKCMADPVAGFVYPRMDGGPPWARCHHEQTCGFKASLFDLLAQRLGSKAEAASLVKRLAGISPAPQLLTIPRATWPTPKRIVVPRGGSSSLRRPEGS